MSYHPNGARVAIVHFSHGVLDGPAEYSLNDRTIWRREQYRDGETILEWNNPAVASLSGDQLTALGAGRCGGTIVCAPGDRRSVCRSRPTRLPRPTVVRLVDGTTAYGRYDHGFRSGEWLFRNEQGNLIKRATFSRGALNSRYWEWYSDGAPKTEGRFVLGRKSGTWRSWRTDGAVTEAHY